MSASKGRIKIVHIYPREMSIYGDLGNTRALASRLRWHGYESVVHQHHPGLQHHRPGDLDELLFSARKGARSLAAALADDREPRRDLVDPSSERRA